MKNKFLLTALIVIFTGLGILSVSYVLSAGSNTANTLLSKDSIMQGNSNSGVNPEQVTPVQVNPGDSGKCGSCCCKKQCGKEKCDKDKEKCSNTGIEVPIGKNPNLNRDTAINNGVPQKDK